VINTCPLAYKAERDVSTGTVLARDIRPVKNSFAIWDKHSSHSVYFDVDVLLVFFCGAR
jgi:hypothetical protein